MGGILYGGAIHKRYMVSVVMDGQRGGVGHMLLLGDRIGCGTMAPGDELQMGKGRLRQDLFYQRIVIAIY